ncbi:hypothetical protein R3P38DRAFT_3170681 [Favolaschia claudopus]|uniref:Proteophosphoglycan ppg4 n=1 Tax=Favolaschia claudopus TaxID=2862362 RepID=A0AAW0DUK1_9AGAR
MAATVAPTSASMPALSDYTSSPRARSRSPVKTSTSTPSTPELHRKSSSSSFSAADAGAGIPRPPSAADLRPNAHPYPIATTTTALLSRANSLSSPSHHSSGKHSYVPTSPSPAKDASFEDERKSSERRRAEYRGHRYSRSLSSSEDMYLPSSTPAKEKEEYTGPAHGPRALPVPPNVSANSIAAKNAAAKGGYSAYAASGISPKRWTPAQLAAHLNSTVSPEAGAWATRRNVGGRAFMKMGEMGEEELVGLGAPPSLSIRPAARALRQEVLQSQLSPASSSASEDEGSGFFNGNKHNGGEKWRNSPTRGNGHGGRVSAVYEVEEPEEVDYDDEENNGEDGTPGGHGRRRTMSVPTTPSHSTLHGHGHGNTGRFRNGRVKGMVREFESSGSESGGSPERERGSGFRERQLPQRPDGLDATVRANGFGFGGEEHPTVRGNGNGYGYGGFGFGGMHGGGEEEELTVEELIAREDAASGGKPMPSQQTGSSFNFSATAKPNAPWMSPQTTGSSNGGGRPLPAHPQPVAKRLLGRSGSGGVHAWEAAEGEVGSTVKRVAPGAVGGKGRGDVMRGSLFVNAVSSDNDPDAASASVAASVEELKPKDSEEEKKRKEERKALEREAEERGRARGERVRAQIAEAAELRVLVDGFRARLEEVERRVGEMEAASAGSSSAATATTKEATKTKPLSVTQRLDPRRLIAMFVASNSTTTSAAATGERKKEDWVGPTTISGLPSYVLLVGLGMCAVVLRVLVRRGLGVGAGAAAAGRR